MLADAHEIDVDGEVANGVELDLAGITRVLAPSRSSMKIVLWK